MKLARRRIKTTSHHIDALMLVFVLEEWGTRQTMSRCPARTGRSVTPWHCYVMCAASSGKRIARLERYSPPRCPSIGLFDTLPRSLLRNTNHIDNRGRGAVTRPKIMCSTSADTLSIKPRMWDVHRAHLGTSSWGFGKWFVSPSVSGKRRFLNIEYGPLIVKKL